MSLLSARRIFAILTAQVDLTVKEKNVNNRSDTTPGGWSLRDILRDIMVAGRLLLDPQVSLLLKLMLPVLALAYWISPVDLLPGLPFDDFAVIMVAARIFVNMAPPDAVARALHASSSFGGWRRGQDDDAVDATWRVVDDE